MSDTKLLRYTDESKNRDIHSLAKPAVSISVLIFTINKGQLEIILIKRIRDPFKNYWSIPGDIIYIDESLRGAARRVLYEKTGIQNVYLEQVRAFGTVDRDPRGRVITVAYFALLPQNTIDLASAPDALHASWVSVKALPLLAFDHKKIVDMTIQKIKRELEYTNLAKGLLPEHFRLYDLQKVYEAIREQKIDKRNFRKKILSLGLIEETGDVYREGKHRPAKLYRFVEE